ncbi:AfsR/SARP family transcriptional regulator [Streptomyces nymphaeiformis]|uniref:DNA-binding SARP family transcriptional activator n=1 Tax=Streptomyces nymphaeiformis TaxID=2663842 RepID=A0A7W7U805_9ACTN|nr:BTAD domain-containing putative transcriptional regulator [Streptomyces nymphaeiformis]MBB4986710.1 DNA-binding SARP family transcriptional activator [Streptomyces nymphaeiformis]
MSVPSDVASPFAIRLLDAFAVRCAGRAVAVPPSGQRLVAYLALRIGAGRTVAAGALWPEASEEKSQASLRTAVWRVNRAAPGLVVTRGTHVSLAPDAVVDNREFTARVRRILRPSMDAQPPPVDDDGYAWLLRGGELLPGWYDDWVLLEQEHTLQLRLHALEAAARRMAVHGRYAGALELAFEAVRLEPLRESASSAVIAVHLSEGNAVDAVRHYEWFRRLLDAELGLQPSAQLTALARGQVVPPRGPTGDRSVTPW